MLHTQTSGERAPRFGTRAPTGTAQSAWAVLMMLLPLAVVLAGCRDEPSPTAPVPDEPLPAASAVARLSQDLAASDAQTTGPVTAAIAIEDALERVLPALEAGGPTAALDEGLRQLHTQLEEGAGGRGLRHALRAVQDALDRYQAGAGEAFLADISVVQLALDAAAHG